MLIAVSLLTNFLSTNVLLFVSCHEEVLVVCKEFCNRYSADSLNMSSFLFYFYFLMFYLAIIALEIIPN